MLGRVHAVAALGMEQHPPQPIYVCGATASGKSEHAVRLATELGGEIVNADAFQLVRGLEVLSAAPSAEERTMVPHHLYGVIEPRALMDAGRYLALAKPVIEGIQGRGKVPIVTGGSGLYLKFLSHGPSDLPQADAALRAELDSTPLDELVAELRRLDPTEASRTALENRRYVSRAIEICRLSGQRASDLRDRWAEKHASRDSELRGVWIQRSRPELHRRIGLRTKAMLEHGAVQEVEAIANTASDTCRKAIGFAEILALLAGEIDRPACEDFINAATRQYAKRQETWFRREPWLRPLVM